MTEKEKVPSWVVPPKSDAEEGKLSSPPIDPKRDYLTVFIEKMDKIIDGINSKEAQIAHHLDKQNQLLEKAIPLLEAIMKYLQGQPTPTPVVQPTAGTPVPAPTAKPVPAPMPYLQQVRDLFPNDLKELLKFNQDGNTVIIKPRRFLGSDNFAKIASIVRDAGGEYISAGKESHFKVQGK